MKTLILMRHAKTEELQSGQKDFDRDLIFKGLKDAANIALWIKKKFNEVDEIMASAAKRTLHTATIVKEICGGELNLLASLYHADANGIFNHIHEIRKSTNTLVVVGHNPAISDLASFLSHKFIELKPSDIMVFELENKTWSENFKIISFKHHSEY